MAHMDKQISVNSRKMHETCGRNPCKKSVHEKPPWNRVGLINFGDLHRYFVSITSITVNYKCNPAWFLKMSMKVKKMKKKMKSDLTKNTKKWREAQSMNDDWHNPVKIHTHFQQICLISTFFRFSCAAFLFPLSIMILCDFQLLGL